MSIIAIMQPTYLPWLGYFDLMDQVDTFIFLDDVNVLKRNWAVRNRVKTIQGEVFLTVPLKKHIERDFRLFSNTPIDYDQNWVRKHLKTIAQAYAKSPFFSDVYEDLENALSVQYKTIADLNITIISLMAERLGIKTPSYRSSEIQGIDGHKDERLVKICHALGANQYLSPQGSAAYIESKKPGGAFPDAGIELFYQNFEHPEYPQQGKSFLSHMSLVDMLMNCGFDNALNIIRSGRKENFHFQIFRKKLF